MTNDHCYLKLSEDETLQSFTNDINQIRPCEMLNKRIDNVSDPNVADKRQKR